MSRDPLYKLETTVYAIGLAVLGAYTAGVIVKDWLTGAWDQAVTWTEQRS